MASRERPREKLAGRGARALSDEELVAALLGTGTRSRDVRRLAAALLSRFPLEKWPEVSWRQWMETPGLGPAKASRLLAALELGQRSLDNDSRPRIDSAAAALAQLTEIRTKTREHFLGLYLDARRRLLRREFLFIGSLDATVVHPREVFRPALECGAASLLLAHNHPSGDPEPSQEDLRLTRQIARAGSLLEIPVEDHLIVAANGFVSLRSRGIL